MWRGAVAAALTTIVTTTCPAVAAPAHAPAGTRALLPVECISGTLKLQLTPGLELVTVRHELFTGSGSLAGCTDPNNPSPVFGGTVSVSGSGDQSCLENDNITGTVSFAWNGGVGPSNSTVTINELGAIQPADQVLLTGTVTAGRYAGTTLAIEWVGLTFAPGESCEQAPGVRHVSGEATGVFTSL